MKFTAQDQDLFLNIPEHLKGLYPAVEFVGSDSWKLGASNKRVLVEKDLDPSGVINQLLNAKTAHLLQKNAKYFHDDIESLGGVVDKPLLYFDSNASALIKDPVKMKEIEFSSPDDKPRLKQECEDFVTPLKTQNVIESVDALVEELYMNAVLDAPREAHQTGRDEHPYVRGEKAKITLVMNNQRLLVSCSDPYGSLKIPKFTLRMQEVYSKGAGEAIRFQRIGGAGLGCVIMFEHCSSLFLGVLPNRKTVVSCIVPLGLSYRLRAEVKKSLHLIEV